MKPAPVPATSDLMALICLVGNAVRGANALGLLGPLLVLGLYCPPVGLALRIWLAAEERYATTEFGAALFAEADGVGGGDEVRDGWIDRDGPVQVWRHVTRFGVALLIPIRRVARAGWPVSGAPGVRWVPVALLSGISGGSFFVWGLAFFGERRLNCSG